MQLLRSRLVLAFVLLCAALTAQAQVVISQVYGAGGNSGAVYNRDYVELFNRGAEPVALGGKSVQYTSATGTGNFGGNAGLLVALPEATVQPGQYFLIGLADGNNGAALPATNADGTINMSGSSGKVVLAEGTTSLGCNGGSTPCTPEQAARILDLVGFGSANYFEGSGPATGLDSATAALRAQAGCTDSNDNAADFSADTPAPRNSSGAIQPCDGGGGPPVLNIADASVAEGAAGASTEMLFTLSLSAPAGGGGVTVTWATTDGTAQAGSDYNAAAGTATIAEGERSVTIGVTVIGDDEPEPDETFQIVLSNPVGATLGRGEATGTIVNDDIDTVAIHTIQGSDETSPLVGQQVATRGIVTGRKANGFFVQTADAEVDDDPLTSEGLFVYSGSAPPEAAQIGNAVIVQGTVVEYVPTADPGQFSLTQIIEPKVVFISAGNALPEPVLLTPQFPNPSGPLNQLERVESMRVTAESFTVVAATAGRVNETEATSTSNGQLNLVVTGTPRPFREAGIQAPDPAPGGGNIPPIPRWDFNPELLFSDTDALGGPLYDLAVGATLTNYLGPLDYGFRRYSVHQDPTVTPVIEPGPAPAAARAPNADEFTFSVYNLARFFDTNNDPDTDDPVLTPEAFAKRLNKASLGIRQSLHTPDILGVAEMENLQALQALANKINADASAAGQPDPGYVAYLEEGNDVGGIDVGFLVKTGPVRAGVARVQVQSVTQLGKDQTWTEPDGTVSLLNDRPPLAMDAVVHFADGRSFPLTAIVVHQRSLNGAEDDDANGSRVRAKRQRQAEYLANQLQAMQAADPLRNLVVGGDFNAFEFNDGLTDVLGTVTGLPAPDEATAVPGDGADLVDPDLLNLYVLEPRDQRYSYEFGGNAQSLKHILINQALGAAVGAYALDHARINVDFPETNRNLADSPSRLSDHDPLLAYFSLASADLSIQVSAAEDEVAAGAQAQFRAIVANAGPQAAAWPGVSLVFDAALPDVEVTAPEQWQCDDAVVTDTSTTVACAAADALAAHASVDFDVQATMPAQAVGTRMTLTGSVDARTYDPQPDNNRASDQVSVIATPAADLVLTIAGPRKIPAGLPALYRYRLKNHGNLAAHTPSLVLHSNTWGEPLAPPGWRCTRSDAPTGGYAHRCRASAPLRPDKAVVFGYIAKSWPRPRDGYLRVHGSADSATQDANPDDNTATFVTRVH